jgi:hypothetical protein
MTATSFVPNTAVNGTATDVAASSQWMRTAKATVMRLLPEQMSATRWWQSTRGELVDIATSVPAWVEHYYGVPVGADSTPHDAVHAMLTSRSAVLAQAPIHLVADRRVRAVLVTLAATSTYRGAVTGWPDLPTATVVFADPVPFRHPSAETGADNDVLHGLGSAPTPDAQLKAVTWWSVDATLRCMDWIAPQLAATGSDYMDTEIANSTRGQRNAGLPAMIGNAEWARTVTQLDDVARCQERITEATAEVDGGAVPRWDGSVVDDTTMLLAPALAAAAADAVQAGLLTRRTRRTSRHRQSGRDRAAVVTLLDPA